jgi:hypothetical protein
MSVPLIDHTASLQMWFVEVGILDYFNLFNLTRSEILVIE